MKHINKVAILTKISGVASLGCSMLLLCYYLSILSEYNIHFRFNSYEKVYLKFDTLINAGTRYISYSAKINSFPNFEAVSFTHNQKFAKKLDSVFKAQNNHLLVFFKDYESPAYFIEDDFQEISFVRIWKPILSASLFVMIIFLFFFFWRYKYRQAILATGVSLEEYHKQMEAQRPKRKSLSEEYEELMKKENEKNNNQ